MDSKAQTRLAVVALFLGVTGIGFAPVLVRLSEVGPSATAFYRVLFALPLLWLWMSRERAHNPAQVQPASFRDYLQLALAGVLFVADLAIWHWSLQYTSVANSTLLTNLAPVFVATGGLILFSEKSTTKFIVGMIIGLIGAGFLVGENFNLQKAHLLGDFLSLIAAVFYAAYLLSVKYLRQRFSGPTILAWSGFVSCPGFLLAALPSGEKLWPAHLAGWLILWALALVSHVGGQTLIAYAFGHLPAGISSVGLLWQPVVAGALAWPILHEPLSIMQMIGGSLVLAGIALANQPKKVRS
ncbi:MAG TPA: DMT family transporter [Verrucomicrobiae bacterium]